MKPGMLETADRAQLNALWLDVFGHVPAATLRPELLRPVLAHGLQRRQAGTQHSVRQPAGAPTSPPADPLGVGSKLLRTWGGEIHEVTVTALGYEYVSRILPLAALSPELEEAIMAGRHAPTLTVAKLIDKLPLDWTLQQLPL